MTDLDEQNSTCSTEYEAMTARFALAEAGNGVAEAQGAIYGLLCNNIPATEESIWLTYVLDADYEKVSCKPVVESLQQLYLRCDAVLRNPGDGFWMLLPGEETPVAERTVAVAAWCRGFLLGLLGPRGNNVPAFQGEAKELIDDLLAISEVEQEDSAVVSAEDDDDNERALYEIQAYVEVAVQYFYEITASDVRSAD